MLALFQVQLNALMLLVDRYVVGLPRSDQDAIVNETTRDPLSTRRTRHPRGQSDGQARSDRRGYRWTIVMSTAKAFYSIGW